jgi:heterodisulfide reductase subunit A
LILSINPKEYDILLCPTIPTCSPPWNSSACSSASGPYQGHLVRPSDGAEPKKIAWLQCVGSRDINRCDHGYCSSVCCMYAIKEAVIAKEHAARALDTAIFYMDMRTYGKDFERNTTTAPGTSMGCGSCAAGSTPSTPNERQPAASLRHRQTASVRPGANLTWWCCRWAGDQPGRVELAGRLGVELDRIQFHRDRSFPRWAPAGKASLPAAAIAGPKDIPQAVMEASAAACAPAVPLAEARGTRSPRGGISPGKGRGSGERRVSACSSATAASISAVLWTCPRWPNTPAPALRGYVEDNLFTCSQDTQDKIKEDRGDTTSTGWWWLPAARAPMSPCSRKPYARPG